MRNTHEIYERNDILCFGCFSHSLSLFFSDYYLCNRKDAQNGSHSTEISNVYTSHSNDLDWIMELTFISY